MASNPQFSQMADQLLEKRLGGIAHVEHATQPQRKSKSIPWTRIDDPRFSAPAENVPDLEFVSGSVDATITAGHAIETSGGKLWVHGNSLLCQCPKCNAPMTVRVWLQLADCWRCATSIALTEEQMRAARQLMDEQVSQPAPADRTHPIAIPDRIQRPLSSPLIRTREPVVTGAEFELDQLVNRSILARLVLAGFRLSRVWVVSFLLHLIAILILALIVLGGDTKSLIPTITISTVLDSDEQIGGRVLIEDPNDPLQYDLPDSPDMDVEDQELREIIQQAQQDARELLVDPLPMVPLPDLNKVKKNITTRKGAAMNFAARDPRVRSEMVRKEGGTTMTEAAVSRGLKWLSSVQNVSDGGWSLNNYSKSTRESTEGDVMGTSLALLPFLGAGQTHEFGNYKETVARGLAWLLKNQESDGDLRAGYDGQAGMYAHGQATIVLCEVLAMTGDEQFREPAQKAIRFIEQAQHTAGGWRYTPNQVGDLSVFGWQLMALQSAKAPSLGLNVDRATMRLADYFLDQVAMGKRKYGRRTYPAGSLYAYQPGRRETPAMTAEAILCRMYMGWDREDIRVQKAVTWLTENHFPSSSEKNIYYWYYGTQVMHNYGGPKWAKWNHKMRELLIGTQSVGGRYPGSWAPNQFEWGGQGRRIYTTSLAVCTLEVYYRHLPLFKQIELDAN